MASLTEPPMTMTARDAASLLGMAKRTVLRYIEDGLLPATRRGLNKTYVLQRADVLAFKERLAAGAV